MQNKFSKAEIDDLLTRGVGDFIDPEGVFRKKLEEEPEKIVIKFGVDPTRPDIHLGHAVILHKLRKFQDMGCKVVFLIGDYTTQIGDPTGKDKTRPEINPQEIINNARTYLDQVGVILDTKDSQKYELLQNSIWFQSATDYPVGSMIEKSTQWEKDRQRFIKPGKGIPTVTLWNFMFTLKNITHARLIERDMFQKRLEEDKHLFMHEMMYPVLQGTDSWAIAGLLDSCDLEVGGTDQTFNMLVGRDVMKMNNQTPQAVLAFNLLVGLDGKEKMSKSLDNYIGITDEPNNMYGKVMSIPDSAIVNYFELCTFTPLHEIEEIKEKLKSNSVNPKELKMNLARQVVSIYHGEKKAEEAENFFVSTFQRGEVPENVQEIKGTGRIIDAIVASGAAPSTSAARRLLEDGAVTNLTEDMKLEPGDEEKTGHTYRAGKHTFFKIV